MKKKKNIKDYVVGGIAACLIIWPEVMKISISIFYLWLGYSIFTLDHSTWDRTQALAALIIVMICPLGSYYFYKQSCVSELYTAFTRWISEKTSIINHEDQKEES